MIFGARDLKKVFLGANCFSWGLTVETFFIWNCFYVWRAVEFVINGGGNLDLSRLYLISSNVFSNEFPELGILGLSFLYMFES